MNGHMRYGGTMEIGPVNPKININRVEGIVQSIPRYFPEMKLEVPVRTSKFWGAPAVPKLCTVPVPAPIGPPGAPFGRKSPSHVPDVRKVRLPLLAAEEK